MSKEPFTIWTIGHSNHTLSEFHEMLSVNGVEALADVRRFPGSRKNPQFQADAMRPALADTVEYVPFPELGGRRRPSPNSHNTAWRNESFRGYADFMETAPFRAAIQRLLDLAHRKRTAVMCAEAVWWRCHRALIADYLKAQGICVQHIVARGRTQLHPYTSAANIQNGRLSYRSRR